MECITIKLSYRHSLVKTRKYAITLDDKMLNERFPLGRCWIFGLVFGFVSIGMFEQDTYYPCIATERIG